MKAILKCIFLSIPIFCLSQQKVCVYKKENFHFSNDLKYWSYQIDYEHEDERDSIQAIGQIKFSRTKSIKDELREQIYEKPWFPSIYFKIYKISDLGYAKQLSSNAKILSSCTDAEVGGDLIIVNNYVFVNNSVCLNCIESKSKIDYCRPIVNKIFSDLDLDEVDDLTKVDKAIGTKINSKRKNP